jgi:branched-chain amino acid transport system permease protein
VELFFQQLLNGLTLGGVYGLVALGLTLVFGVLQVPNFAHGALYMAGAFIGYWLMTHIGVNYWLAMLVAAAGVAVLSMLCERLVFYPLRNAPVLHDMIAAIGLMLFLEAGVQVMFGADFLRMPTPYGAVVRPFGIVTQEQRLLIIAAVIVLVTLLHMFLTRTTTGQTIVALAQNPDGAALVGIDAKRTTLLVFAIAGALAAIAAVLYAPINLVYPSMGNLVITKAFVVIILGGMGSFPGAITGGIIIGLAESFGGFYVSDEYKDLIAVVLLVVILSLKPNGLFPSKGAVA